MKNNLQSAEGKLYGCCTPAMKMAVPGVREISSMEIMKENLKFATSREN